MSPFAARGVLLVFTVAAFATESARAWEIPTLFWPADTPALQRPLFGEDWIQKGCDGKLKRHAGVDIDAPVGAPVYAAQAGIVCEVMPALVPGTGWITIEHTAPGRQRYTTNYWHVVPNPLLRVGHTVAMGSVIAQVQGLPAVLNRPADPHFHFGVRKASYGPIVSRELALPRKKCLLIPAFPENFVDPAKLRYLPRAAPAGS